LPAVNSIQQQLHTAGVGAAVNTVLTPLTTNNFSDFEAVDGQNVLIYCICRILIRTKTVSSNVRPIPKNILLHLKHFKVIFSALE